MESVAVLVSGGMDSCILMMELIRRGYRVHPIYLQHDLYWEEVELQSLKQFLAAVPKDGLEPLTVLKLPVDDLYGQHWSVTGVGVPDQNTEDDAVYLPGRNLLLLAKISVWCSLNQVFKVALAPLKGNPFSDNSSEFYASMEQSMEIALGQAVEVIRPFSRLSKDEVIALGEGLPLALTFSCIRPANGLHCGRCNKCAERQKAYQNLNQVDATRYAFADSLSELKTNV